MPLGREVGLGLGHIVLDGHPALPTEIGTGAPTFRPISVVAKLSPISAAAELLFKIATEPVLIFFKFQNFNGRTVHKC